MDKDAYWSNLLLTLSEGRPEGIVTLKQMDSIEFWHFYRNWTARQEAMAAAYKQA